MTKPPYPYSAVSSQRDAFMITLVLTVVTATIFSFRAPDLLTSPQLWAEDGGIFFRDQYRNPTPQLFSPYWGYLHFVPRLIAWFSSIFPTLYTPTIYAFLGLVLGAASITLASFRLGKVFNTYMVWTTFVLLPGDNLYYGYIQNLQWLFQFTLIALCLVPEDETTSRPSTWSACLALGAVAVCGLTGPFSALVLFAVVLIFALSALFQFAAPSWRITSHVSDYCARLPKDRLIILAVVALCQLLTALVSPESEKLIVPDLQQFLLVFGRYTQEHLFGLAFLPAIGFLLLVVLLWAHILLSKRVSATAKILLSLTFVVSAIELFLGLLKPGAVVPGMGGDRYFFLGKVAFWWSVYLVALAYLRRKPTAVLAVVMCLFFVGILNTPHLRRPPPPDLDWPKQVTLLEGGERHYIEINPFWWGRIDLRPRSTGITKDEHGADK